MKKTLFLLSALGLTASGLSTANIFSASTDTAKLNGLEIHTGVLPTDPPPPDKSVDLQLATHSDGCGEYSEDLSTQVESDFVLPTTSVPDEHSGGDPDPAGGVVEAQRFATFCLRNVGTSAGVIKVGNIVDSSVELACSPGEADLDATCEVGDPGELDKTTAWFLTEHGETAQIAGGEWGANDTVSEITLAAGAVLVFDVWGVFTTDTRSAECQSDRLLSHFDFTSSLA